MVDNTDVSAALKGMAIKAGIDNAAAIELVFDYLELRDAINLHDSYSPERETMIKLFQEHYPELSTEEAFEYAGGEKHLKIPGSIPLTVLKTYGEINGETVEFDIPEKPGELPPGRQYQRGES